MSAPLYRVRYVRVSERKAETVDQQTLDYLLRARHMGIRVTSYRAATPREVASYTVAKNVANGFADTSALAGQAFRDAEWVLSFADGTKWTEDVFRPNRWRELIDAGVLVPTDEPGLYVAGTRAPQ